MALDTRAWNLGVMALGVGACGPLVPLPAETDGETRDDDDDPSDPSATAPTTTTGDCDPACPPGYYCIDGVCEYNCQSCCVGECGGYYECFSHEDCFGQEYCNYYACTYLSYLYECPGGMDFFPELIDGLAGSISLAFADTNGDGFEDLAALAEVAWILRGPETSDPTPMPVFAGYDGDIVATEFDGADPIELTFSFQDAGLMLTASVIDDAVLSAVSDPALEDPVAGDFDADGRDDIAGLLKGLPVAMFNDGMQFSTLTELPWAVPSPLAVGSFGLTPGDDVVFLSDGFVQVAEVSVDGGGITTLDERYALSNRAPVVGDFNGDGIDDVSAIGERPGSGHALLATWVQVTPGELSRHPYFGLPGVYPDESGRFATAVGDIDGDGVDEIVIGGSGNVLVVFVGNLCIRGIPINSVARIVAVGDFDGNGRDDIAWSDAASTVGLIRAG